MRKITPEQNKMVDMLYVKPLWGKGDFYNCQLPSLEYDFEVRYGRQCLLGITASIKEEFVDDFEDLEPFDLPEFLQETVQSVICWGDTQSFGGFVTDFKDTFQGIDKQGKCYGLEIDKDDFHNFFTPWIEEFERR